MRLGRLREPVAIRLPRVIANYRAVVVIQMDDFTGGGQAHGPAISDYGGETAQHRGFLSDDCL